MHAEGLRAYLAPSADGVFFSTMTVADATASSGALCQPTSGRRMYSLLAQSMTKMFSGCISSFSTPEGARKT